MSKPEYQFEENALPELAPEKKGEEISPQEERGDKKDLKNGSEEKIATGYSKLHWGLGICAVYGH